MGEVFEQARLPSVAGEILSGMIVGPTILGLVATTTEIEAVSSIALFFIVFHIGFEMNTQMVRKKLTGASLLSITSFLVPLVITSLAAIFLLPFGTQMNLIVALAISVPSISIVSVLVLKYDLLSTNTGQLILASVTISDVLAFIILAGVTRPFSATLTIILETLAFVLVFALVDFVLNRKPASFLTVLQKISRYFKREDFSIAFLIIVGLTFSFVFQSIGLSYILGPFFAGLLFHDGLIGRKAFDRVSQTMGTMNKVFFVPLFFGFAGVEVSLLGINASLYAALAIMIIIALGVGIALSYWITRRSLQCKMTLSPRQTAAILGGRGAIGIVIASVALSDGVLNNNGFAMVVLATLITSLVVPFVTGTPRKDHQDEIKKECG